MRSLPLMVATWALFSPFATAGQKKQEQQVKIICPPLHLKIVKQVKPEYPKEAKQSGIEGKVSLRCLIRSDGSVGEIEVNEGKEPFVQAAKTAVAQWKYKPMVLNGVAVQSETTVDVIFQIPRQKSKRSESITNHISPQN